MPEIIEAFQNLIEVLFDEFGAWNTIIIFAFVYLAFILRRVYLDRRKDRDVNKAIMAMESAVQRSAQEAREWRILFFQDKAGWSLEEAERVVMKAMFESPEEARKALEKKGRKKESKK